MISPARAFIRFKLPAFGWFFLIMILLSLPGKSLPSVSIWQFDKLVHFVLFFVQALLLWIALELPEPMYERPLQSLITAGVLVALFGAASEVYQHLATDRSADLFDVIANAAGVVTAVAIVISRGAMRVRGFLVRSLLDDETDE